METLSILILTGSRAWMVSARSRAWARWALARAYVELSPDVVAHGAALGWDTEGDQLAAWLSIARAVFPLREARPYLVHPARGTRPLANEDRYPYQGPLPRNAAMMRWGADRAAEGHRVIVLSARAPWSNTGGTRHAIQQAALVGLPITDLVIPPEAWPDDRECGGVRP